MRRRFFVDRFEAGSATLRGDSAEHLGRVLRAEPGQLYELSDGQRVWLGRVKSVALSKRGENRIDFTLVELLEAREPALRIELFIAVVKFDRFESCLEKATELGASEIIPLAAARSDKPLIAAAAKRRVRWERILLESAQQSRRLRPPTLRAVPDGGVATPAGAFAQSFAACKVLLSERRDALPLREVLRAARETASAKNGETAALAIGPEGGWTDDEIAAGRGAGFVETSLGENILRTETAVLAAMAILGYALGR